MIPRWFSRPLSAGDSGRDVEALRRLLGLGPGFFDRKLDGSLYAILPDYAGEVTSKHAEAIGPSAEDSFLPEWFVRPLEEGEIGLDVQALNVLVGVGEEKFHYTKRTTDAIRRWQSANGDKPDGVLTPDQANRLGNLI